MTSFGPIDIKPPQGNAESRKAVNKPTKSFEKVLRKEEGEKKPDDEHKAIKEKGKESVEEPVVGVKKGEKGPSLFELAGKQRTKKTAKKEKEETPSPSFAVTEGQTFKELEEKETPLSPLFSKDLEIPLPISKEGQDLKFSVEQPEIAALAPKIPLELTGVEESVKEAPKIDTQLQKVIEQIIEKLYIMKAENQTDTVITLKNMPLLEGAKVTISSFSSAKGEFNIAFENLTQAAQNLIDINRDSLKYVLEHKGYTVHMITTTTYEETKPVYTETAEERSSHKRGEEEEGREKRDER